MTIPAADDRITRRPKVFICQEPQKFDPQANRLVSAMNFAKAAEFGDTVVCVPPGQVALSPAPLVWQLRDALRDYQDGDYVIAVGDPTVMFVAAMVLGELNRGRCRMLKWDKQERRYLCVEIDLHKRMGA